VFGDHLFISDGRDFADSVRRPSFSRFISPEAIYLKIAGTQIREDGINKAQLLLVRQLFDPGNQFIGPLPSHSLEPKNKCYGEETARQ